jgi:acetolactate synthase I/II/III large subunit
VRVADYVADFIYDELHVHHIFNLVGAGNMHLSDGIVSHGKIKTICTHNEQTSSMALESYSRATENFGVGFFTTGPGCTNAITGLAGAWQDSVPCLFLSGQVKKADTTYNSGVPDLRQFGVQELNIIPIVESISKYSIMLTDPEMIRYELEKAVYIAKSGRPGPVWIDIPLDVQSALIDPTKLKKFIPTDPQKPSIDIEDMSKLISLLKQSKRPTIIAGRGVRISKAINLLSEFADYFKIPIITPYLGIDNLTFDNPNNIGTIGIKGTRAANLAMQNCDLLISIGSSLNTSAIGYDYDKFAPEAKKVVIDISKTSHQKKNIQIDLLINSDAKDTLRILLESKKTGLNDYSDWLKQCILWKEKYPVCMIDYYNLKDAVNTYVFLDLLSKHSANDDVFVSDASAAFSVSQGIKLKSTQRYIASAGLSTMGYALPAAIGVSVATGNRVIAISGDGSIQLNIQELQTVLEYNLPIKLFVINNDGYHSIRVTQDKYFNKRFIGESPRSGLSFPDIVKVGEAYGIKSVRVSEHEKLEQVIEEVLNYDGPVICDIMVPRDLMVMPSVSSKINDDGSMTSRPLEDMFPFLERDEYRKNLYIKED